MKRGANGVICPDRMTGCSTFAWRASHGLACHGAAPLPSEGGAAACVLAYRGALRMLELPFIPNSEFSISLWW